MKLTTLTLERSCPTYCDSCALNFRYELRYFRCYRILWVFPSRAELRTKRPRIRDVESLHGPGLRHGVVPANEQIILSFPRTWNCMTPLLR